MGDNEAREVVMVRSNHPNHFRSGKWARAVMVVDAYGRDCWLVTFQEDGVTDLWVVDDPVAEYEFVYA